MNGRRKPRQPRVINANVISRTICRVTRLMPHEIAQAWGPIQSAWDAVRAGNATDDHVGLLIGAMYMATAINRQGFVKTDEAYFTTASDHFRAIDHQARRDGGWHTPPAPGKRAAEEIGDALLIHQLQIQQLSAGELEEARHAAEIAIQNQHEREAV